LVYVGGQFAATLTPSFVFIVWMSSNAHHHCPVICIQKLKIIHFSILETSVGAGADPSWHQ